VAGVRRLLTDAGELSGVWLPTSAVSWSVTGIFVMIMFLLACRIAAQRTQGDLL
jgi:hypothetical protein